jgi:hypothetical protein
MDAWNSMDLRQRAAYFIALGELVAAMRLADGDGGALAREAIGLAWAAREVRDVDVVRFDTIAISESVPDLYDALCSANSPEEESAWGCLMDMVGYLGYYYANARAIVSVPQSIENVSAVDVKAEFDSYFDRVISRGGQIRESLIRDFCDIAQDQLTRQFIENLVRRSMFLVQTGPRCEL